METGGVIATAAAMGARRNVSAGGLAATLTRPGIVALLWIGVALHFALIIQQAAAHRTQWDFSHYYVSALAMRQGLNPYTTDLRPLGARLGLAGISRSSYPPSFILGFEPLTFLRPGTAWLTWLIVNLAALGIAMVWLVDTWRGVPKPPVLAVAALALLYPPVSINLFYSQTQILILLMLVAVMHELADGREITGGLVLALAGLLKIFPLILAGYFVVTRRWRALAATAAGFSVGLAAVVAIIGPHRTFDFVLGAQAAMTAEFISRPANVAIGSFVSRLFWYVAGYDSSSAIEAARRTAALAAELGVLALTVIATRGRDDARDGDWRAYSLWVVATFMLSPTAWIHYMALLLLPFVMIAEAGWSGKASARSLWLMVASYGLITLSMMIAGATTESLSHVPIAKTALAECATVSLLLAYASAWFFAVDDQLPTATHSTKSDSVAIRA